MNYWFIFGKECFKFGSGNQYIFFYCKTEPLSTYHLYELIKNKNVKRIIIFEDLFLHKPNGLYSFTYETKTININKRLKQINIHIMELPMENAIGLEDFLKQHKFDWKFVINNPMLYVWHNYIVVGIMITGVLLLVYYSYNMIFPKVDMEYKYQLLNSIS